MPASRKRNKGRDRKAKQLAKKEENESADANRFWRRLWTGWAKASLCNHGCDVAISNDHSVSIFIDQLYINLQHKRMFVSDTMRDTLEIHTQIWKNERCRKLAIGILVRIGTNMLLEEGSEGQVGWSMCLAQCIVVLEHCNGTKGIDSVINSRLVRSKWRDLNPYINSDRRDALKFFRKRTSCKCLKKMHLEARNTLPKLGACWNCDKEAERVSLSICSKCMVMQYCSRECQVANYKEHKEYCDEYARIHKQNKQQDIGTSRPTK